MSDNEITESSSKLAKYLNCLGLQQLLLLLGHKSHKREKYIIENRARKMKTRVGMKLLSIWTSSLVTMTKLGAWTELILIISYN